MSSRILMATVAAIALAAPAAAQDQKQPLETQQEQPAAAQELCRSRVRGAQRRPPRVSPRSRLRPRRISRLSSRR